VGHGASVLKNQYLMPEVITYWVDKGEVFNIKEAGYVMEKGGEIDDAKSELEFNKLFNNLFVVTSNTQEKLAKTFIRLNGYLDSEKFKDKIFTLDEFKKWYIKEKGEFTYYKDYKGFNIPDNVVDVFLSGKFDPLSEEEKWLLDNLKSNISDKPYYIIGYVDVEGEEETRHHELAHALYYLSPSYKEEVNEVIDKFWKEINSKSLNKIEKFLENLQYNKLIWNDEMNAYLIEGNREYLISKNAWSDEFEKYGEILKSFFEKNYLEFFGQSVSELIEVGKTPDIKLVGGGQINTAIDKMISVGMTQNNQSMVKTAKFIGDFDLEKDTLIKAKYEDLKYWVKKAIPSKNYEALSDWQKKLGKSEDPKEFMNIVYWESHGDVIGRIPKYTSTLEKKFNNANVTDPEVISWAKDYLKRLKEFIPIAEKFEAMKSRIGKKEISKESKESNERQEAYAKIYAFMPLVNKEILSKLVEDITKSFKPFEEEIYKKMDARYRKLIQSYVENKEVIKAHIISRDIFFYEEIFDIEKQYDKNEKVKKTTRQGYEHETWETYTYLQGFSKKDGWENILDLKIRSTIEGFRVELLFTIMEKFEKITLPILKYKLLDIKTGYAGFEGAFEFKFNNGSSFIFETQAIVAGGYNIQIEHLRYISHFKNATLSDGTKLTDPHLTKIVQHFSVKEPEKEKVLVKSSYIIGDASGDHTKIDVVPYMNKLAQKDENRFFVSATFMKSGVASNTKTSDRPIDSYDEYILDMVNRGGAKKMEKGGEIPENEDFANSEKNRKFTSTNITKDELQSIISGKSKVSDGDTIQFALTYIRREEGTNSINRITKPEEEQRLIEFIDGNNLWYTSELNPPDGLGRGGEHIVYEDPNDEDFILKTNNLSNYHFWSDYLINLLLNNTFFPDTSYELIGFNKNEHGNVLPVVRQQFVPKASIADLKDVQKYLMNRGFMKVHPLVNAYRNWDLGIMIGDLHERNVFLKKDTLFFIDTKFFISHNVDYVYNKGGEVNKDKYKVYYGQGRLLYIWNFLRGDFDRIKNEDFDSNDNLKVKSEWVSDKESAEKVVEDKSKWSTYRGRVFVSKQEMKRGGYMEQGGKLPNEELIAKYNLSGNNVRVRFINDNKFYWIKNISLDRKTVWVLDDNRIRTNKKIQNIVEVEGRKVKLEHGGEIKNVTIEKIFNNPIENKDSVNFELWGEASHLDGGLKELISSLPIEEVKIENIIPTQTFVSKERLAQGVKPEQDLPLLIKWNNKYYVEDGHHRIILNVLSGKPIMARVFDRDAYVNEKNMEEGGTVWDMDKDIEISKILEENSDGQKLSDAIIDVKDGLKSQTEGNVVLEKRGDKYEVSDGFHRIAESILNGQKIIRADIVTNPKTKMKKGGEIETVVTPDGSKGGVFKGVSHEESTEGGMPTIVTGTKDKILVEGDEALLVPNISNIKKRLRCVGKPKSVLSAINEMGGGANFSEEQAHCELIETKEKGGTMKKRLRHISGSVVSAPAGSMVINKKNTQSEDLVVCEGTPVGMASAINEIDGNGVNFADNGECKLLKNKTQMETEKKLTGKKRLDKIEMKKGGNLAM